MHELEKVKLVRHHAKRLRQLGADDRFVNELVARLNQPEGCSSVGKKETAVPQLIHKACPAKVCRGALGFSRSPNAQAGIFKGREASH